MAIFYFYCIQNREFLYTDILDKDSFGMSYEEITQVIDSLGEDFFKESMAYVFFSINKNNFKKSFYNSVYSDYLYYIRSGDSFYKDKIVLDKAIEDNINKIENFIMAADTETFSNSELSYAIEEDLNKKINTYLKE